MSPTRTTWLPGARCSSMQSRAWNIGLSLLFSRYRFSALGLFKISMFSVQSHLEHILPELGWSCHVAGGHSTNIISSKRSSFPVNICKAIEQRKVELADFCLPIRLQKTRAGRSCSVRARALRYSKVSKESAPFLGFPRLRTKRFNHTNNLIKVEVLKIVSHF